MCKSVIISASIGLIILGITYTGAEELEFLPQLAEISDSTDNKVNLRLMHVVQQYASKFDGREGEDSPVEEDSRRKRSTLESESTKSSAEPEGHSISKRQTETRRTSEDMGFKNRPGFRSWGGKRAKFANWGGKRGRFATWGGKRSKFNNWGGKRSDSAFPGYIYGGPDYRIADDDLQKKDKFRSWGGKRGPVLVMPTTQSKFSNWGGKRDAEYPMPYEQQPDQRDDHDWRRGEFQSWGGKRSDQGLARYLKQLENIEEEDNQLPEAMQTERLLRLLQDTFRMGRNDPFEDAEDSSVFDLWKG
ncbi:UNVERIFIED_CONTAM: hypothetical protein PYX00_007379 [Menopon gallinae]|uniref:Uncharacterized protein n=1 Tax=Menopon gallinae TaxID=328185 RepID=A0AAW2HII5_9NEOP